MPAQLQQKANPAHQRQGWLFVCYGITVGRFLYLPKICFYKNDRCNWEFWQRIGQPYARNLGRCFVAAVDILSLPICVSQFAADMDVSRETQKLTKSAGYHTLIRATTCR